MKFASILQKVAIAKAGNAYPIKTLDIQRPASALVFGHQTHCDGDTDFDTVSYRSWHCSY
jgi:hypothetical protein